MTDLPHESPRRLAAILAADIAGYSRLMEHDEKGTHWRVQRLRRELVDPTIAEHRGRLIKNTGDGFLAMFDSPVEAVRCAIVIQQSMVARNLDLLKPQWIQYRIGINLGDVIVEPDDIYGDGVNIAARLEQLAEPGSVYVSGGVYEQIKYKLVCGYQSLGDRKVKNITEPVPIYRVLPDPAAVERATRRTRWRWRAAAALVILATLGGLGGGWYVWRSVAEERAAGIAATLPSLTAVLPGPPTTPAPEPPATAPAPATLPAPAVSPQVALVPPRVEPAPPQPLAQRPPQPPPAFREPAMVPVPGGTFRMGSNEDPSEGPVHRVTVAPFLIGKYPVRVAEWRDCVAAKACTAAVGSGEDDAPAANLSWTDAQDYVTWLSLMTGKAYRLPTEAEWEYAARGGTETKYWWGNLIAVGMANCKGCGEPYDPRRPAPVGRYAPNPLGLYDMAGGVAQWVEDCWHKDYHGAPADGSAWAAPNCREHVLRGGSWRNDPDYLRTASRERYDTGVRYLTHGLRVARSP